MKVLQKEINEIVRSCAEDENLRRVVLEIHSMTKEERNEFFKKMEAYFSQLSSSVDRQAYKFFSILFKDDVRNIIVERINVRLTKGS